jgi:hypothetical protein
MSPGRTPISLVSAEGVPSRCNFNSLLCPTALKALSARKSQFSKLSNLPRGLAALDQFERTTTKNPSAVAGRGRAVLHGGLKNRNPPGVSRTGPN